MRIKVTQRWRDWHARIEGRSGCWGCGATRAEAVGALVLAWPELFSITAVLQ